MSRSPDHVIRFGLVKVCIWKNQTKSGDRHSVTVVRLFRNGDVWQESTRFGRDDLPLLAKAIDQAHTWIFETNQRSADEQPASAD
ncbi:MAG: hypothetical protein KDA86_26480 [Planctomycetaceae bacterium]|nr:hypothetical protein [Planctomycetaceae bacterium]